jgi:hypothetical protein
MIRAKRTRAARRDVVPDLPGEEWRDVVGFEGLYAVSNLGRIKCHPKVVPNPLTGGTSLRRSKIMRTARDKHGHHHLVLTKDGVEKNVFLHHAVAVAFLGPRPDGKLALHRDDDKDDNRAVALYYGTAINNAEDRERLGTVVRGEAHHAVVLTEEMARAIFALRGKMKQIDIAKKFGTTVSAVSHIHHGWSWAHVTGEAPRRRVARE